MNNNINMCIIKAKIFFKINVTEWNKMKTVEKVK